MAESTSLPARLIVRGDDLGTSHSANQAFVESYLHGILTTAEIMAPAPWFPQAVRLLAETLQCDVGVHLTLSSEWENVKWRPLSAARSLVDEQGYFFPLVFPDPACPKKALSEQNWSLADIETELRAQIELAQQSIPRVSHVTAHMGCSDLAPEVRALVQRLAKEYGLGIDPDECGVASIDYAGPKDRSSDKIGSFIKALEQLQPGQSYLFIDHPGLDTPELGACYNSGYTHVASDRQGVTDMWTCAEVKAAVRRRGITLISYRDLQQ